jgi:DNA-binding winged helix-turn-helix (wHTH) protein
VRFATFEVDLSSGELRKGGMKLKLGGQPFQVLEILLEHPGAIVTRDDLQKRIWPDTFVDVDHNLNTAINKIREVLGDSAENPRFVETLPRRGYRFIGSVNGTVPEGNPHLLNNSRKPNRGRTLTVFLVFATVFVLLAGVRWILQKRSSTSPTQRALTRLTFDQGLQVNPTWSPDGRFLIVEVAISRVHCLF